MERVREGSFEKHVTASAFVVRVEDLDNPRVMLHRHKRLGTWLQFGGHLDPNESLFEAALRETKEEAGYDTDQLWALQSQLRVPSAADTFVRQHPHPFSSFDVHYNLNHADNDHAFALATTQEPRHAIATRESATIELFTLDDVRNLPESTIAGNTRQAAAFLLGNLCHFEQVPIGNY